MNKFILSILLAFTLVFSVVNADMTADAVTVEVVQGSTGSQILTLETGSLSVSDITYEIKDGELKSTDDLSNLPASKISFDPEIVDSIMNDSTKDITIQVSTTDIVTKVFEGVVIFSYVENGSNKTLNVDLTVEVKAQTTPTTSNQIGLPSSINFGDDLERYLQDDDEDEWTDHSKPFTITNNGNTSLTGLVFDTNLDGDFNVEFTNTVSSLAAGASHEVTLKFNIPEDEDAGDFVDYRVTVSADGGKSNSAPITGEVENYLSIDDIEVKITHQNGDEETEDGLDDEDTVDEPVSPGDEVEIIIFIENNNGLDVDFDNNDIEVTIENGEMDVDETEKDGADEGDNDPTEFKFNFEVDEDANDGDEDLRITVVGIDENGARHEIELELTFEIEELEDSVSIESIDFPSVVQCGDNVRLEVEIENLGTNDLDEAEVRVEFPQWDIIEYERDIELDEGDNQYVTFNINVPEDFEGSSYADIEAFFERGNSARTDDDTVDFTVNCGSNNNNNDDDEEDDNDDIVIVPGDNDQTGNNGGSTPTGGITAVGRESFFESTGYLVLLAVLVVILIVVIVGLILTGRK